MNFRLEYFIKMNKINKPQKKPSKNNNFLNSLKLFIAMSLAVNLSNNAFSQKNTNNNTQIEYNVNKLDLEKYKSMIETRDKYISQTDNKYMNPNKYFVLNQKKMFLKSYELNRNNTKTYVDDIKDILKNKFNITTWDDPTEIIKVSIRTISNREDMNEIKSLLNFSSNDFDENFINTYGYIQSMFPELWKDVWWEKLPTWRLDWETLKRIISLLNEVKYTIEYEDATNINQETNANNGDENNTIVIEDNDEDEDEFVNIWDLTWDYDQNETEIDENDAPISNENNNEDKNNTIVIEDNDENLNDEDGENKVIIQDQNNNWNQDEDKNEFISIWDLTWDDKQNENKENNNESEINESENKNNNLKQNQEVINLSEEEKMQNWIKDDLEKNLLEFWDISINENNIEIKLFSPNYKNIVKENLNSKLWPLMQAIKKIDFVEDENNKITKIKIERDFIEKLEIDTTMSVLYDFKYKIRQELPISKQKENINNLMNKYIMIKKFVSKLNKVWIDMWSDFWINRVAAILRSVNWNFKAWNKMLDMAIDWDMKWSDVVWNIILQARAMNLDGYQLNLIYNNFQNPEKINQNNWNGKISLPVNEDMLEINKEEQKNLKITEEMSWNADILSKKLDSKKLNWISYQEIINVVNWFKSKELQKAFIYAMLENNVVKAQSLIWMELDCHDRYPDYKAWKTIWKSELQKIKKLWETRRYMGQNEIMANAGIPQDVKSAYMKFVNWELNNKWRAYSILSKTDFNIYLFSKNHYLISRQDVLVWKDVGDKISDPNKWINTTPGGLYEIGKKFEKNTENWENFFVKYWTHYILLVPLEWQYKMSDDFTLGIHGLYEKEESSRLKKIKSWNAADRRISNGCVNILDELFGEIFNHLENGWIIYITNEPSKQEINKYQMANK